MEKQYSVACLIVGILSCVLCCMCLGFPLGIAGVVLFILSTRNGNRTETKAAVGLALSIVGFILSIITVYLTILIMTMTHLTITMITTACLTNMMKVFLTMMEVMELMNFKI